jgi:hypothetical protein
MVRNDIGEFVVFIFELDDMFLCVINVHKIINIYLIVLIVEVNRFMELEL